MPCNFGEVSVEQGGSQKQGSKEERNKWEEEVETKNIKGIFQMLRSF